MATPEAEERAVDKLDDAVWSWLDAGLTVDGLMEHVAGHQGVQDATAPARPATPEGTDA